MTGRFTDPPASQPQETAVIRKSPPAGSRQHCYGIVMHHCASWWLVEFPELGGNPVAAHRLSGRLTPALGDWLRQETGDPGLADEISAVNPEKRCWSGEFSRLPSELATDSFDIDAHPWGSEAGELEERLARAMIESTLLPIPAGFISVFTGLPDEDIPVLAIRISGYRCAAFELLTARYMPTYRPRSPWRDISAESVGDSGSDILGWTPAQAWIRPG
jgi:hypothetical protein